MYFSSALRHCQQSDRIEADRKFLLIIEIREWLPGVHLNGNPVMGEHIRSYFAENVVGGKESKQSGYIVPLEKAYI
jgi:hypothetical protein